MFINWLGLHRCMSWLFWAKDQQELFWIFLRCPIPYANSESYNGPSEPMPMPDHSRSRPSGEKRDESWLFFSGTHNLGRYDCFSPKNIKNQYKIHTKIWLVALFFERILHCFLGLQWGDVECAFSKRYCIYYRWIFGIWFTTETAPLYHRTLRGVPPVLHSMYLPPHCTTLDQTTENDFWPSKIWQRKREGVDMCRS